MSLLEWSEKCSSAPGLHCRPCPSIYMPFTLSEQTPCPLRPVNTCDHLGHTYCLHPFIFPSPPLSVLLTATCVRPTGLAVALEGLGLGVPLPSRSGWQVQAVKAVRSAPSSRLSHLKGPFLFLNPLSCLPLLTPPVLIPSFLICLLVEPLGLNWGQSLDGFTCVGPVSKASDNYQAASSWPPS